MSHEDAELLVQEVSALCAELLLTERRSAAPDPERVERLKAEMAACGADLQAGPRSAVCGGRGRLQAG